MEKAELKQLINESRAGSAQAMEKLLCEAHTHALYQCRRFLKSKQDVQDAVQDVMLTVYTKLDTLEEPAAFFGWVGRICANRCINMRSRGHGELPFAEDEDGNSMLDNIESEDEQTRPDAAIDNAETARMIGELVDALPQAQRMCVLLYYYDEMSVKEISSAMDVSENTVKSRLNYARKSIKEGVLAYEKKGVRLYSFSPLPLLLYFLRKNAEENADAQAAKALSGKIMRGEIQLSALGEAAPSAPSGAAAGEAEAASAAGAPGAQGSALAGGGISIKIVAIAAAGIIGVGAAAAGIAALTHSGRETVEETGNLNTQEDTSIDASADGSEDGEGMTAAAEETREEYLSAEALAGLPYTGDLSQCTMTKEMALAYAEIIEESIAESEKEQYSVPTFCWAALFDAGDGIPALWTASGVLPNYPYDEATHMPDQTGIYCWDGEKVSAAGVDTSNPLGNYILTKDGLLLDSFGWGGVNDYHRHCVSELYSVEGGLIGTEPVHVYEQFGVASQSEELLRDCIAQNGYPGMEYDFGSLEAGTWSLLEPGGDPNREEPVWAVDALDGVFLNPEQSTQNGTSLTNYNVDWLLGHGSCGATDVSHLWDGDWQDADKVAGILRRAAESGGADALGSAADTGEGGADGEQVTWDAQHLIRRTTLDNRGYRADIYFEMPVFPDEMPGSGRINAFFEGLQAEFLDPQEIAWIWDYFEDYSKMDGETDSFYRVCEDARVNDWTEDFVSVTLTYISHATSSREYSTIENYNFRTDTGEQVHLGDLVDGTEEEIRQMIMEAVGRVEPSLLDGDFGLHDLLWGYDMDKFNFYVQDGRIIVCFPSEEIFHARGPEVEAELDLPPLW